MRTLERPIQDPRPLYILFRSTKDLEEAAGASMAAQHTPPLMYRGKTWPREGLSANLRFTS